MINCFGSCLGILHLNAVSGANLLPSFVQPNGSKLLNQLKDFSKPPPSVTVVEPKKSSGPELQMDPTHNVLQPIYFVVSVILWLCISFVCFCMLCCTVGLKVTFIMVIMVKSSVTKQNLHCNSVFLLQGGMVLNPAYFGRVGHHNTMIHEMGHILGLYHVFKGVSERDSCDDPCQVRLL